MTSDSVLLDQASDLDMDEDSRSTNSEQDNAAEVKSATPEIPKLLMVSSCKPEKIYSLFETFEYEKINVVRAIGFGGLLHNDSFHLNLDLCIWLLQRFDFKNRCLHLPGGVVLPIRLQDVNLVLGIPCEGRPLFLDMNHCKESVGVFIDNLSGCSSSENLTLAFIESILKKDYGFRMTSQEKDAFIISTVLYAVTYLLAPGPNERFRMKVMQNLLSNINLLRINWSTLVLWTLHRASIDVRQKLGSGCNHIMLYGCCLFLQVFYIDNLKFPCPTPNHSILPRTSAYWPELLDDLILSDCTGNSETRLKMKLSQFGRFELRSNYEVGYTRAWMDGVDQPSQDLWCIEILTEGIESEQKPTSFASHDDDEPSNDFVNTHHSKV